MDTVEAKFRQLYDIMNRGYYYQILQAIPNLNERLEKLIGKGNVLYHKTERIKVLMQTTANSLQRTELSDKLLDSKIDEVEKETTLYNNLSKELYEEIDQLYNEVCGCVSLSVTPQIPLSVETAHELINKQTNEIIDLSSQKLQYDNKILELEKEIEIIKNKIHDYESNTQSTDDQTVEIEKKIQWLERTELLYKDLFNIRDYSIENNHLTINWKTNYQLSVFFDDNDRLTSIEIHPSISGASEIIDKCKNKNQITFLLNEIQYLIISKEYLQTVLTQLQKEYDCTIVYDDETNILHMTSNPTGLYMDLQLPKGYPQSFSAIKITKLESLINDNIKVEEIYNSVRNIKFTRLDEVFKTIFEKYNK